jgi:hypothetical protein
LKLPHVLKDALMFWSQPRVLKLLWRSMLLVGGLSLVAWPRRPLSSFFIRGQTPPMLFFVAAATLVILAYLNLRHGAGELTTVPAGEPTGRGGWLVEALHTLFWLLPFLPFLLLATAMAGITWFGLLNALALIISTTLLCRLVGLVMARLADRSRIFEYLGFLLTRLFLVAFLFVTAWTAPTLNPLHLVYHWPRYLAECAPFSLADAFVRYLAGVWAAILVLALSSYVLPVAAPKK